MGAEHEARIPLMPPAEAAGQLGHSDNWMYRGALAGRLPHHKVGNKIRFCTGCLEEIVAATYQPPAPQAKTEPQRTKAPQGATARRYNTQKPRPRRLRSA